MKLQAINQQMNNSKSKNVSFKAHERLLVIKPEKLLAKGYIKSLEGIHTDPSWTYTRTDYLLEFTQSLLEPKGFNVLVSNYVNKGNQIDIYTGKDLMQNANVYEGYLKRRDAHKPGQTLYGKIHKGKYTMAQDYGIAHHLSRLSPNHIHLVKSPQDVLRVLEAKMPELGVTYDGYKHLVQKWLVA